MEKISKEDRMIALDMFDKGFKIEDICFTVKITIIQARNLIAYHRGISRHTSSIPIELSEQAWEMYKQGVKHKEISDALGVRAKSVYALINYRKRKEREFYELIK